jgi:hypothetical protein
MLFKKKQKRPMAKQITTKMGECMTKFVIHEPIWKDNSVGLAKARVDTAVGPMLEVEIDYETKAGERLYPNVFRVPVGVVQNFPVGKAGRTSVYLTLITAMKEVE